MRLPQGRDTVQRRLKTTARKNSQQTTPRGRHRSKRNTTGRTTPVATVLTSNNDDCNLPSDGDLDVKANLSDAGSYSSPAAHLLPSNTPICQVTMAVQEEASAFPSPSVIPSEEFSFAEKNRSETSLSGARTTKKSIGNSCAPNDGTLKGNTCIDQHSTLERCSGEEDIDDLHDDDEDDGCAIDEDDDIVDLDEFDEEDEEEEELFQAEDVFFDATCLPSDGVKEQWLTKPVLAKISHTFSSNNADGDLNDTRAAQFTTNDAPIVEDHQKKRSPSRSLSAESVSAAVSQFLEKLLARNSMLSRDTLTTAIQDCYGRFILNLPHQYLSNHIQLCFAIQEAYWWYDDYWFEDFTPLLPKLSMRNFGFLLCEKCPLLRLYFDAHSYAQFMSQWRRYCQTIPLKGAILLNNSLTKVLMVQGWRGGRWMFPRGKVDELEDDVACAVREVREEVGVDVSKIINPNIYIETNIDEQPLKLFVIPGVLESTPFGPRKRKEISRIRWIPITSLPGWRRCMKRKLKGVTISQGKTMDILSLPAEGSATTRDGDDKPRFWNVHPFTEALAGWIRLLQKGSSRRESAECAAVSMAVAAPPLDLNTEWLCDARGSHPEYSFPSPPKGYNAMIEERYSKQVLEDKRTEFLKSPKVVTAGPLTKKAAERATSARCRNGSSLLLPARIVYLNEHRVSLTSLTSCQPAAPKPPPLPPFIDDSTWYRIPGNTSCRLLRRLQHPQAPKQPTRGPTQVASRKAKAVMTTVPMATGFTAKVAATSSSIAVPFSKVSSLSASVMLPDTSTSSGLHKRTHNQGRKSVSKQDITSETLSKPECRQPQLVQVHTNAEAAGDVAYSRTPPLNGGGIGAKVSVKTRSILRDFQRLGIQVGPMTAEGVSNSMESGAKIEEDSSNGGGCLPLQSPLVSQELNAENTSFSDPGSSYASLHDVSGQLPPAPSAATPNAFAERPWSPSTVTTAAETATRRRVPRELLRRQELRILRRHDGANHSASLSHSGHVCHTAVADNEPHAPSLSTTTRHPTQQDQFRHPSGVRAVTSDDGDREIFQPMTTAVAPCDAAVDEVCRLACAAYQAVNTCRERVGHHKLSAHDFANILGL